MPVAELINMPEDEGGDPKADTVLSRKLKKVCFNCFSTMTNLLIRFLIRGLKMTGILWMH